MFHKEADYAAFLRLFDEAPARYPMRVLAYCLMPKTIFIWSCGRGATAI